MTAEEFLNSQSVTDASSIINPLKVRYNRFDLIKFAEAYHIHKKKLQIDAVCGEMKDLIEGMSKAKKGKSTWVNNLTNNK